MNRAEQKFLGKLLFTFDEWDDVEAGMLQFYNVEFLFPSMRKYNGGCTSLQLDGTMKIYDNEDKLVWEPAFPTDIEDWEEF